jgi:hypothetical protein
VIPHRAGDRVVLGVEDRVGGSTADLVPLLIAYEGEEDRRRMGPDLVNPAVDLAL